jgi:hypothetical protein
MNRQNYAGDAAIDEGMLDNEGIYQPIFDRDCDNDDCDNNDDNDN